MDDRKEEFALKYKSVQKKLTVVVTVIIILFAIAILAMGFLLMFSDNKYMLIVAVILMLISIFDIILGIKFCKISLKRIKNMPSKEAAYRYSKITGKK